MESSYTTSRGTVLIRPAEDADTAAIARIRNDAVLHSTALWTDVLTDEDGVRGWLRDAAADGRAYFVAEFGGEAVAYAGYGPWRSYSGYAATVDDTIYVDGSAQGLGIGKALLGAVVEHARAAGRHVMVADIESGNAASIRLHERFGFEVSGTLREVGAKYGQWLDLTIMTLALQA